VFNIKFVLLWLYKKVKGIVNVEYYIYIMIIIYMGVVNKRNIENYR